MELRNLTDDCETNQPCLENKSINKEMLAKNSVLELEKKMVVMDKKIDVLKHLRKSSMDNSLLMKKKIQSEVNDLINLLRERENQLFNIVEEMGNCGNLKLDEELSKLCSIRAQYHNICENRMNFKDDVNVLVNFHDKYYSDLLAEDYVLKKVPIFDGQFDCLKAAVKNYGTVKYSHYLSTPCFDCDENATVINKNTCINQIDECEGYAELNKQISLLWTSAVNCVSSNIVSSEKKSPGSYDSFEILEAENIAFNESKEEALKDEKNGFPKCIWGYSSKMSPCNYEIKTSKVTDWLKTNEVKNYKSSETDSLTPDNMLKKEKFEPLSKLKMQLQKLMDSDARFEFGRNHTLNARNFDIEPEKSMNNFRMRKAFYFRNSDTKNWLQHSDSKDSYKSFLLSKSPNNLFSTLNNSSPSEYIQEAFAHYFIKENSNSWLSSDLCPLRS